MPESSGRVDGRVRVDEQRRDRALAGARGEAERGRAVARARVRARAFAEQARDLRRIRALDRGEQEPRVVRAGAARERHECTGVARARSTQRAPSSRSRPTPRS